jgi:hypothetical protein
VPLAKARGKAVAARSATCLLSSKVGLYCGEVVEISQPLFPIGMNTPISIAAPPASVGGSLQSHAMPGQ